jgi:hypothetical protein
LSLILENQRLLMKLSGLQVFTHEVKLEIWVWSKSANHYILLFMSFKCCWYLHSRFWQNLRFQICNKNYEAI